MPDNRYDYVRQPHDPSRELLRHQYAMQIWEEARSAQGTIVETYRR